MKKSLMKLAACVLCLSVVATSCYKESIEHLQQQIDELQINSLIQQVAAMQSSVDGLAALKDQLKPAVDKLQEEKSAIEAEIQKMMAEAGDVTKLSAEQKATLADLQNRMEKVENSIASLEAVNADLDVRIAAIEEIINTPKSGLKDRVTQLEALKQNFALAEDLAKIKGTVDDMREAFDGKFVAALEDLKDQISTWVSESTEIKNLFNNYYDCAYIDAALAALKGKDAEQDSKILELASSISAIKTEIQESVLAAIDGIYDKYDSQIDDINDSIDAFKKNFDDIVAALWDKIGREDLAIEGTIVSVINTLLDRFGLVDEDGNNAIDVIVSNLRAALDVLRTDFLKSLASEDEEYQGETLAGLHKLLIELQGLVDGKADDTEIKGLIDSANELTIRVQTELLNYIEKNDGALNAFIAKANDPVEGFALISALSALDEKYQELVKKYDNLKGELKEFRGKEDTIIGWIQALNNLVGIGEAGEPVVQKQGWTESIVEAINGLYSLVGEKIDKDDKDGIVSGIVTGIINELLDVTSQEQAKAKILKFATDINSLLTDVGNLQAMIGVDDLGAALGGDKDIAAAIKKIKSVLATLDETYAKNGHEHASTEIKNFAAAVKTEIEKITGRLEDLKMEGVETLVEAINKLHANYSDIAENLDQNYYLKTKVNELLSVLESTLAAAILQGDNGLKEFVTLNLNDLKDDIDKINEMLMEGGEIDSRISAKINKLEEDLNVGQYLSEEDLLAHNFATKDQMKDAKDIAAALKVLAIQYKDGKSYGYDSLGEVIQYIYDTLNEYIDDFSELKSTFNDVQSRIDNIWTLIGAKSEDKFTDEYKTVYAAFEAIKSTIESLEEMTDGLGGANIADLINGLQTLYDDLIVALVGEGGSLDDIKNDNLKAIRHDLDNLGFDDIKAGGKTLTQELTGIKGDIESINQFIDTVIGSTKGTSYGSGTTVIEELTRLSNALGSFNNGQYSSWAGGIDSKIKNILNILVGSSEKPIERLTELRNSLDQLTTSISDLGSDIQRINNRLEEFDGELLILGDIVGDCSIFSDKFESLAMEIYWFRSQLEAFDINSLGDFVRIFIDLGSSIRSVNQFKGYTGIYFDNRPFDIFSIALDKYIDPDLTKLNTDYKKDFVGAIVELFDRVALFNEISTEDLNKLEKAIIGAGDYTSLKAIALVFETLQVKLGEKTDDFDSDNIVSAIVAIDKTAETLRAMLGKNDTSYPDVWTAINDLRTQLAARSINSLVYIPEYDDGKATAVSDGSVFTVEMDFRVNAPASLADVLSAGKLPVKGLLKTPGAGVGTEINGNATYSNGVLSVSLFGKGSISEGSSIAVVLGSFANGIMSQYIPVHISSTSKIARIKSADPDSGTFKFLAGIGGSRTIKFTPVNELDDLSDITVNESITNVDVKGNGLVWTIEASSNISTKNTGKIYFPDNFTYQVEVNSKGQIMVLSNNISYDSANDRFTANYNRSVTITIADLSEYGLYGTLSASAVAYGRYSDFIDPSSVVVNGNVISFNTLARNAFRSSVLTIKVGDITLFESQVSPNQ